MTVIGLTGGIASGKSTVSKGLADLGAIIIDADKTAHRLMEPHQPIWTDVLEQFGAEILNPDKSIDRPKLGNIVFTDPEQLKILNRITGPRILEHLIDQIGTYRASHNDQILVLDIALLYESNLDRLCDQVWVIWVDRETQIKRLMSRNGYTEDEAINRIESQMSLDEKARRADVVIDNTGTVEETLSLATRYYLNIVQNCRIR